jgi:hypothetical protein
VTATSADHIVDRVTASMGSRARCAGRDRIGFVQARRETTVALMAYAREDVRTCVIVPNDLQECDTSTIVPGR